MSKKELLENLKKLDQSFNREDAIKFYHLLKDSKDLLEFDNEIDFYDFEGSYEKLMFVLIQELEYFKREFYSLSPNLIFLIKNANDF